MRSLAGSGQVLCWERLARAAADGDTGIDVHLHFLGAREEEERLGRGVRAFTHRPVLATGRLGLEFTPAVTDLSPWHPRLLRCLGDYDVLHTTDAFFSFARTGLRAARALRLPLVTSIHTDIPRYSRVFAARLFRRRAGLLGPFLVDRLRLHERIGRWMDRRLRRYLARCDRVLVSRPSDLQELDGVIPAGRLSYLRRGVDREAFHPGRRDRRWLRDVHGIAEDAFLVLFVGRLDDSKNVSLLARAVRPLLDEGLPIRVMMVGSGSDEDEVRRILGRSGVFPGVLPQKELGRLYAAADLFAFPSETEILPNVVLEAKASGLPVAVAEAAGAAQLVEEDGGDGWIVEGSGQKPWRQMIRWALGHPEERARMRERARASIERSWPTWGDVLREDVLPVWLAAARGR